MIIIGVLILFGCCFTSFASSSRCVDFIERMYERKLNQDFTQLTQEESNFIEYSATSQTVPAFGNKPQCDKQKEMKYLVALRIFRPHEYQYRAGFAHGACLPAYCADPRVDPGIPANDTLMRHLFFAGGWFLDTITLYEEQYRLLDPDNWDLPPFFYPTLLLVLSLIGWSVYSTVQLHKRQNNESIALNERGGNSQWLMEAFDLKKNALQLYQTAAEQGLNEDLAVFQFLRAGSCYWVAYYHVSLFNIIFIVNYWTSTENLWIRGSPFDWLMSTDGVENFYFMGGFFAVYTMVAKLSASFKFKTLWELLKHRFIRICPVYMIAVLFFSQVGPYLSAEPGMAIYQTEAIQCYSIPSMIAKAFFLDVLLNRYLLPAYGGFCMGSTYYIGVEFPIQAFAILVIAVYAKYRKSGRILFLGLILQSAILTNYNFSKYNGFSGDNLYLWERKHLHNPCGIWYTFFNGAFWGALYHEYSRLKKKNIFYIFEKYPKIGYLSTLIGFIITVDIRAFWLYKWYTISWSVFPVIRSIIYSTTLALFYGPLITTRPNALKRFLNHRVFQIVGKTSFLFYLSQDWVIRNLLMGTHTMRYYHFIIVLLLGIAALILTQIVAIVFHLTIEKPLLNIEMRLTRKAKSPSIKGESNQRKAANSASYAEMVDEKEMEIELSSDKDTQGMEDKEDNSQRAY